jgi:hypothetical protein
MGGLLYSSALPEECYDEDFREYQESLKIPSELPDPSYWRFRPTWRETPGGGGPLPSESDKKLYAVRRGAEVRDTLTLADPLDSAGLLVGTSVGPLTLVDT